MKGVVLQTLTIAPRKPNSGKRKCCKVRLSGGQEMTAFIPGIGHTLQPGHVVLVEGRRTKGIPGVRVRVIRGKYDCGHPLG